MSDTATMIESAKSKATARGMLELATAIGKLASGDVRGFRAHERAFRGFVGTATDTDLYTEWERRCLLAYRVCWTLSDGVEGELHDRLVDLGWMVLECGRAHEPVVERAEALVECGWVELEGEF